MKRSIPVILCLALLICSCGQTYKPWEGFTYAFDKDGRTTVLVNHDKHHYMLFTNPPNLENSLNHTPDGKIDRIIKDNPSWQFLIYCRCCQEDSTKLMSILKKHDCSFPVIMDPEGEFLKINRIEETYSEIGLICDKEGKCHGVSTIGTSQSFFDQQFRKAKSEIR